MTNMHTYAGICDYQLNEDDEFDDIIVELPPPCGTLSVINGAFTAPFILSATLNNVIVVIFVNYSTLSDYIVLNL